MSENQEIKNKIETCLQGIDQQFQKSTTNIENSLEQFTEFKQSNQGLADVPKQSCPQPKTDFIANSFSKLSDELFQTIKQKL